MWRVVPTPTAGPRDSFLNAVAVVSPTDAWAVGMRRDDAGRARTLAMRWDGRAWSTVPTPNFSSADHRLSSVAIVSRDLVWAVGDAKHAWWIQNASSGSLAYAPLIVARTSIVSTSWSRSALALSSDAWSSVLMSVIPLRSSAMLIASR